MCACPSHHRPAHTPCKTSTAAAQGLGVVRGRRFGSYALPVRVFLVLRENSLARGALLPILLDIAAAAARPSYCVPHKGRPSHHPAGRQQSLVVRTCTTKAQQHRRAIAAFLGMINAGTASARHLPPRPCNPRTEAEHIAGATPLGWRAPARRHRASAHSTTRSSYRF